MSATVIDYIVSPQGLASLGIIAIAVVAWSLQSVFLKRQITLGEGIFASRRLTAIVVLGKTLFVAFVAVVILQVNGVDVGAMIAGLGVVSIVLGFALQDTLKDALMGLDIMMDRYYSIGDVISFKTNDDRCTIGEVLDLNLKVTKLRDVNTNDVITLRNSEICRVSVVSDWLDVTAPTRYDLDYRDAIPIMEEAARRMEAIDGVTSVEFKGTNALSQSSVDYLLRVHVPAALRPNARRASLRVLQEVYAEHGIEFPLRQIEVVGK